MGFWKNYKADLKRNWKRDVRRIGTGFFYLLIFLLGGLVFGSVFEKYSFSEILIVILLIFIAYNIGKQHGLKEKK